MTLWQSLINAGPRMWGLLLAGPVTSLLLAGVVGILWAGGWSQATEHQRIWYLGCIALLLAFDVLVVVTALAAARVNVKGIAGTEFSADASSPSIPTVTTTTEIKP